MVRAIRSNRAAQQDDKQKGAGGQSDQKQPDGAQQDDKQKGAGGQSDQKQPDGAQQDDKQKGAGGQSDQTQPDSTQQDDKQKGAGGQSDPKQPGGAQQDDKQGTGPAGSQNTKDQANSKAKNPVAGKDGNQPGDKADAKDAANTDKPGASGPGGKDGEKTTTPPDDSQPQSTRPGDDDKSGTTPKNPPNGGTPGKGSSSDGTKAPGSATDGNAPAKNDKVNKPAEPNDTPADEANLEYARQQTELALEHLRDQLAKEKPALLDRLGWTKDEAQAVSRSLGSHEACGRRERSRGRRRAKEARRRHSRASACSRTAPSCAVAASRPTSRRIFATAAVSPLRPSGTSNSAPTPAASPTEIGKRSKGRNRRYTQCWQDQRVPLAGELVRAECRASLDQSTTNESAGGAADLTLCDVQAAIAARFPSCIPSPRHLQSPQSCNVCRHLKIRACNGPKGNPRRRPGHR